MFFKQAAARCKIAIEEVDDFFNEVLAKDLERHDDGMVTEMQDQLRWLNNHYSELTGGMMEWGVEVKTLSKSTYKKTQPACALNAHIYQITYVIVLIEVIRRGVDLFPRQEKGITKDLNDHRGRFTERSQAGMEIFATGYS